ncbi:MAG: hypothetical protein ABW217_23525 [Polyangiaceae bacterium]
MDNFAVVRLVHADAIFARVADGLIKSVRLRMGVPDRADADVEEEFSALRKELDTHIAEFSELFAGLLRQHVGDQHLGDVLTAMESPAAQRYLQAVGLIDHELEQSLELIHRNMTRVACAALGEGPESPVPSEHAAAASGLARVTGADRVFFGLVQAVVRQVLEQGRGGAESSASPGVAAERVRAALHGLYPAFDSFYASLFIRHVGAEQAPLVLGELTSEPMRRYLHARAAMSTALAASVQQLRVRMGQMEL